MKEHLLPILKSDLAKSSSIIFLALFSSGLIMFFAELLFSKIFGPVIFGRFRTILYLFSFLPLIIELGIGVTLTKYIAEFRSRNKEKIGYIVKWFLKLRILSYLVLMFLIFLFKEELSLIFLKDASLSYLIITGIFLVGLSFFNFFSFVVLGYQKFKLFAISNFLTSTASSIFGVLMIPFGIFFVIIGWSFGSLIGNILNIKFFFDKKIIKISGEFNIKKIFWKFSIPMYLINIPTALFNFIIPLLSLFFSQLLIGYYSFALIFYSATLLISTAISTVLFPKVSELNGLKKYDVAKKILKKVFLLYILIVFIGIILVVLISDWLFVSFFESYLPSLFMFKALVIFGLFFGLNTIYTNYLKGLGKVKKFALFTLIQNILLIIISFVLLGVSK